MLVRRICLAALLYVFSLSAYSQTLIRVYVQAGEGEFAANGASDSALDLKRALQGKQKTLVVVESAAEADVVARVDSRRTRKETTAVNTYANTSKDGKQTTVTTTPQTRHINELHVTLLAGNSEVPLDAESELSWRLAAGDMAGSIDKWVKQNSAKLTERRGKPAPAVAEAVAIASAATSDATIAPGMTEADVQKVMGTPEKKVGFGSKAQWSYRGMQVVFEGGKVVDVKF